KKGNTMKTEVRINDKGRIVQVSKSYPGSVYDFKVFKHQILPPQDSKVLVNSGYHGIYRDHKKSVYPYKNTKCQKITSVVKDHNTLLAKTRIKVENIIRNIKTFNILAHKYRNQRKR
ncbi:MAG: putative transposase, partial [Candidatus Xenolissoclinum pacificiensis L6]